MAGHAISQRNANLPTNQAHPTAPTNPNTTPDKVAQWHSAIDKILRTNGYSFISPSSAPGQLRPLLDLLLEGKGPKDEQQFFNHAIQIANGERLPQSLVDTFLAHPHFSTFHATGSSLNDGGFWKLASALEHNATIKTLELDLKPSRRFAMDLIYAVQQNRTLTSLTFAYSPRDNLMHSAKPLAAMLHQNTLLKTLKLSVNEPSGAGMAFVFKALQQNRTLRHLELTNYLVIRRIKPLCAMLEQNSTLTHLRICTTSTTGIDRYPKAKAEALTLLAKALKNNTVLQELVWEELGLFEDHAEHTAAHASPATGLAASPTTNTESAGEPIPVSSDIAFIQECLQRNRSMNFWAILGATHSVVTQAPNLPFLPHDVAKHIANYVADAPRDSARAVVCVNHGTQDAARIETIQSWFETQANASDQKTVQNQAAQLDVVFDALFKDQAPNLSGLDLSDDNFGTPQLDVLFEALRSRLPFDSLDLSNCKLGSAAIGKLAKLLSSNPSIRTVNLSGNAISPAALKQLTLALMHNDKLISIDLSNCGLNDARIAQLLFTHPSIRAVNLSGNPIYSLDLSYCGLDDARIDQLTQLLSSYPSIHTVNLSGNRISIRGLQALRKEVKANPALVEIKIDYNEINIRGSAVLREMRGALQENARDKKAG